MTRADRRADRQGRSPAATGAEAEAVAAALLERGGIRILERNYRCRYGEIDIIGLERQLLIFVEVRYRRRQHRLAAVETVDRHKCRRLLTTGQYYLNRHKKHQTRQYRFDVLTITGELSSPAFEWIKNAFQA